MTEYYAPCRSFRQRRPVRQADTMKCPPENDLRGSAGRTDRLRRRGAGNASPLISFGSSAQVVFALVARCNQPIENKWRQGYRCYDPHHMVGRDEDRIDMQRDGDQAHF